MAKSKSARAIIQGAVDSSLKVKRQFFSSQILRVERAAAVMVDILRAGGKILLFGNGGSAADAQHIAAELVNRLVSERQPLPAIALTTDSSILTSISNDYNFEQVFARQIRALGKRGDLAVAISTSGNSPNILAGLKAARSIGVRTLAILGKGGGRARALADLALVVGSQSTPRIQEVHITLGHVLCELVEEQLNEPVRKGPDRL